VKPAEHLVRLRGFFTGKPEALREFTALADRAAPAARKLTSTDQAAWWHSLADAHRRLGAFDRAAASERKACEAVESAPNSMRLALALTAAGQWRKAAAAARQAAKIEPEPASFWVRGWALARAGDEKAGRADMECADLMAMADVNQRNTLAQYMQTLGDVAAAARQRELIARLGDFDAWEIGESLPRLAERAARAGRFAAAATMWERSRLRCLDLDTAMSDIGGYLFVAVRARAAAALDAVAGGRMEEALEHVRVAREAAPQDIEFAIALTPALEKAGRKDAADELFAKTFEFQAALVGRFPRYSHGHNAIAWLAARTRRALPAGLEHARQAVELSPDAVRHQDTLAEVLFQLGRRDEAVAEMKKCVGQVPGNRYFRRQLKRMREDDPATDPPEPE
jgi:tetratricopeptide (TPR) repeat protein